MLNLPVLDPNPTLNIVLYVVLYLVGGIYFVEQTFHPFRDGECPGEETNERLIMFMVLAAWPVVAVSMLVGAILLFAFRTLKGAWKLISKLFSS